MVAAAVTIVGYPFGGRRVRVGGAERGDERGFAMLVERFWGEG